MSFVKIITESFNKNDKNIINESKLSIKELDNLIVEDINRLTNIKSKYEDIKSTWNSLKEDLQAFSFYSQVHKCDDIKEQFQKAIDDLKIDYIDAKNTLEMHKEHKNKLLLEDKENTPDIDEESSMKDEIITNNNADNNNDNDNESILEIQGRDIFNTLQSMVNTSDIYTVFEFLHKSLVPTYGKAATKAGEILRALMALIYESFESDGEIVFYEGVGKNKLKKEVSYLKSNGYDEYLNEANGLTGDDYLDVLERLIEKIARDFLETPEILWEENLEDYISLPIMENLSTENSGDESLDIEIPLPVRKALKDNVIDNDTLYREVSELETNFGMLDDIVKDISIDREMIHITGISEDVKEYLSKNLFNILLEILDNYIEEE